MSNVVIAFSFVIGFISSVIIHHPPGERCSYVDGKTKCVSIRLF